ncbi:MAG: DUF6516 family protein [Methanosarcinales archaeon]
MYETIYLLSKSKIIENFEIINFVVEEDLQLLNVKCFLVDESVLYIRDVIISSTEKYSYHWQNGKGKLIVRWDNSPHHKVKTYPHHKHIKNKIEPSERVTVSSILEYIEKRIRKKHN